MEGYSYNPPFKLFFILEKTFVISDTWFNRPCEENYGKKHLEYNVNIINTWNETVSENDLVYVLGGFGICDLYDSVFQMKGNIIFLNNFYSLDEIEAVQKLKELVKNSIDKSLKKRVLFSEKQIETIRDKDIVLSYFPLVEWYGKKSGSLCFHGMHVTTNMNNNNVCCNANLWKFKPVDIDEVVSNISKFKLML